MAANHDTKTISPECQIIVFKWKHEAIAPLTNQQLGLSTPFDISNYIDSVSFQKNMDGPAGQFQITLRNDRDWKQYIEKGSWLLIYMDNHGGLSIPGPKFRNQVKLSRSANPNAKEPAKGLKGDSFTFASVLNQRSKLRCIGYVDTVRSRGSTGTEAGEFDVEYVVSGRDFGIVYEETEIWHNQTQYDKTLLETINSKITVGQSRGVGNLITLLHQLFLSPDKLVKQPLKNNSLTSIANQWLLPTSMWRLLGIPIAADPYYGNIPDILNIKDSPASYPVEKPSNLLDGVCWQRLKSHSLEPYHELFTELSDDGLPRLTFRLIPWVVDRNSVSKFRSVSTVGKSSILFANEENGIVELPNIDIIDWDIGEDNHTRYNLFWSSIASLMVNRELSNSAIGDSNPETGFPRIIQESVKRHGLRMLYSEVNANILIGSERADPKLIKDFNEFALELWQRSHEYESGTITIIGNNEVRIGKVIHIEEDSQYNSDKFFYIEGYEDEFVIDEKGNGLWLQTLNITRGIEASVLKNARLVTKRQTPFKDAGDFTHKKGSS